MSALRECSLTALCLRIRSHWSALPYTGPPCGIAAVHFPTTPFHSFPFRASDVPLALP